MSNWNYAREESTFTVKTGKLRCVIVEVEEKVSSKGNPMIVVTVKPSGSNAKVKTFIVKNEYFNKNMTQLFDSFPEIGDGNFEFLTWVGAEGAAEFGLDEKGYLKVKWFISAEKAKELPPYEGEKPEKQTVTNMSELGEDEELPF